MKNLSKLAYLFTTVAIVLSLVYFLKPDKTWSDEIKDINYRSLNLLEVQPCLPSNSNFVNHRIDAGLEYDGEKIYLISFETNQSEPIGYSTVIALDEVGCIVKRAHTDFRSLTLIFPEEVANQLALLSLKSRIELVGSKERFIEILHQQDSDHSFETPLFHPEQVWALQQLDIPLPKGYQIFTGEEFQQSY